MPVGWYGRKKPKGKQYEQSVHNEPYVWPIEYVFCVYVQYVGVFVWGSQSH